MSSLSIESISSTNEQKAAKLRKANERLKIQKEAQR